MTNSCLCARTFGLDIGIVGAMLAWRCCKCKANSSENIGKATNMTSILSLWFIVCGRWQLWFMLSLSVPEGFGRANCPLTQKATGKWQMVSSGVHVCLLVYQNRKRVIWGTQALGQKKGHLGNTGVGISQLSICDLSWLILYNDTFMF